MHKHPIFDFLECEFSSAEHKQWNHLLVEHPLLAEHPEDVLKVVNRQLHVLLAKGFLKRFAHFRRNILRIERLQQVRCHGQVLSFSASDYVLVLVEVAEEVIADVDYAAL